MSKKKRRKIPKNADFCKSRPQKSTQCCKNCRFFQIEFIEEEDDRHSWCRRYPPSYIGPDATQLDWPYTTPDETDYWANPYVGIGSWCGEWKPRKE